MTSVRLIRVLASFPSDVADEALSLDAVAAEVNRAVGDVHRVRFEVLNWLRDVRPDVGHDVQAVVNAQVDDSFDCVVATFWARAGTPTPRAESGSIEEVKLAVCRARANAGRPAVMVYMKTAGISPFKADINQLQTLQDFRVWLGQNGVLFKEFSDQSSFEALLRVDLAKLASEIVKREELTPPALATSNITEPRTLDEDEEELGLLDYQDIQENAFGRMSELLQGQISSIQRLKESLDRDTLAANNFTQSGSNDRSAARRLLKRASESWTQFSDESGRRLVDLETATSEAFDATAKWLAITSADGHSDNSESVQQLSTLAETMLNTAGNARHFRNSMAGMPRLTSDINRARRRVVDVLDKWILQFERIEALARGIVKSELR